MSRSERANQKFLKALSQQQPSNAYQVAERLGWKAKLAKDVAWRLHKAGRVVRFDAGVPGQPFRYRLPSARRTP